MQFQPARTEDAGLSCIKRRGNTGLPCNISPPHVFFTTLRKAFLGLQNVLLLLSSIINARTIEPLT